MDLGYNTRNPSVKRLLRESQELHEATEEYYAQPLEDNLFEWHFTFRGPVDSDFEDGIYHGRIVLPNEYPLKPPNILFLTHNGRFEVNTKVCLSISTHHPESWRPSWSIRTALLAIIGFMPTRGHGHLASLDYSPEERRILAKKSHKYECPTCGPVASLLKERSYKKAAELNKEAKEISKEMQVTDGKNENSSVESSTEPKPDAKVSSSASTMSTDSATAAPTTTTVDAPSTPTVDAASTPTVDAANTRTDNVRSPELPKIESAVSIPGASSSETSTRQRQTPSSTTSQSQSTSEANNGSASTALTDVFAFLYNLLLYLCTAVFLFLLLRRVYFLSKEEPYNNALEDEDIIYPAYYEE